MNKKIIVFLFASLLSSVGDSFLYFGLPLGLGLQTNDLRKSIILFLIPALSMLAAIRLTKIISKRIQTSRLDYMRLLLFLGIIECLFSFILIHSKSMTYQLMSIYIFILIYSFIKEGIPRIFYIYSTYNYFVSQKNYIKIVSYHQFIIIISGIFGIIASGYLVKYNLWKWGVLFDALTFIILGLTIGLFGSDIEPQEEDFNKYSINNSLNKTKIYNTIKFTSGSTVLISAMFWPYLPIINEKLNHSDTNTTLLMIALLRAPGLFSSLFFEKISSFFNPELFIIYLPLLQFIGTAFFFIHPSHYSMSILILINGVQTGLYNPSDSIIRRRLSNCDLIIFNSKVLKIFSFCQMLATLISIFVLTIDPSAQLLRKVCALLSIFLLFINIHLINNNKRLN